MPKLSVFEIELDNPSAVYYAGTVLSGRVVIVLDEPMEMRGVRFVLEGRAKTHWPECRNSVIGRSVTDYYNGEERYFDNEISIYGNPKGSDAANTTMPAGRHTFAFSYPLPAHCPSSFESTYGNIRYVAEAKIDRPWKFDHKTKRPFTVLAMRDLNTDPSIAMPVTATNEKTLNVMFSVLASGQITAKATLPKGGYVAGEVVALTAEVANNSSVSVKEVRVRLMRKVTCIGSTDWSTHQNVEESILAETKKQHINPGDTQVWNNEGVRLPPVPISLQVIGGASIISINYFLEMKVEPSGPSSGFTLNLPFVVGSIPLQQLMPAFQQAYRQSSIGQGGGGGAGHPIAPGADMYPQLPPPAFMEAGGRVNIKEGTDNQHTRGQLEFAPRYAYYDWASAPANQNAPTTRP